MWGLSLHTRLERPVLILIITRNVPKLTKSTLKVSKILVYFDRRRHFDSAVPTRGHPPPVANRHFPPERFHLSAAKIAANSIKHNGTGITKHDNVNMWNHFIYNIFQVLIPNDSFLPVCTSLPNLPCPFNNATQIDLSLFTTLLQRYSGPILPSDFDKITTFTSSPLPPPPLEQIMPYCANKALFHPVVLSSNYDIYIIKKNIKKVFTVSWS